MGAAAGGGFDYLSKRDPGEFNETIGSESTYDEEHACRSVVNYMSFGDCRLAGYQWIHRSGGWRCAVPELEDRCSGVGTCGWSEL